ncbi:MAG TPA: ribosome small subunit-dependent GTPase A [bacterium]|nr:ribosome small subunit-dependent GTPase A [bacterium]HPS30776.1 ribosome small subunit-dependent GTPase A [bacterium]
MDIKTLGFDSYFKKIFDKIKTEELVPARVISHGRRYYSIICETGILNAKLSGSIRFNSLSNSELPAVGDWVAVSIRADKAYIISVLARKTCFSRKSTGNVVEEQIISANIDIVFIVMSLDENYNLKRLQRYISTAISSKATPIVLLNKSDLCNNTEVLVKEVKMLAGKIEVFAVSSENQDTYEIINRFLKPGITAAFAGSSGVGKSTLINILTGSYTQKTAEISQSVKKGRHTTSSRDLIILSNGGMVIDTPGMRELQSWDLEEDEGFEKINELSVLCRFTDCKHETEPGCAVKEAIKNGEISESTLSMWKQQTAEIEELKLQKEKSVKILENRKSKRARKE